MDNHISFFRKLYRLFVKGQSSKAVWLRLIQKWAFGSIQNNIDHDSEEIHANWVCSTCKRIVYFDLKRPCLFFSFFFFFCEHLIVNDTAIVWKSLRGSKCVPWNSCRTTSSTLHFLQNSYGNCRRDWSKYVISSVPIPHEMSFRHHTRKG